MAMFGLLGLHLEAQLSNPVPLPQEWPFFKGTNVQKGLACDSHQHRTQDSDEGNCFQF